MGWIPRGEKERFGQDWTARRPGQKQSTGLGAIEASYARGSGAERGRGELPHLGLEAAGWGLRASSPAPELDRDEWGREGKPWGE